MATRQRKQSGTEKQVAAVATASQPDESLQGSDTQSGSVSSLISEASVQVAALLGDTEPTVEEVHATTKEAEQAAEEAAEQAVIARRAHAACCVYYL